MSERESGIDVCPECAVRNRDSSEKKLYQCQYCERCFCEKHLEPRLAVFRDLNSLIKDKEWRTIVEEDWKREDGHPDYAYTKERFDELKIEKEIIRSRIEGFLDKSRAYRKIAPKEQYAAIGEPREPEVYVKPLPIVETSVSRRPTSNTLTRLRNYFLVSSNLTKIGLLVFVVLLLEYLFLRAYFNSTIYVFVALGTLYLIYRLFIISSRIQVTSDLRLWGLRILSGLVFLVGLLLLVGAFMSYAFSAFTPEKLDNPAYTSVFVFFGVFGLGLMLLSSYLMFRFMLKSGVIIYSR